ncbi:hypothetical protein [Alteromonas aestuariivivens]|nr:hypothetical protein [Alteromonas aestuariivivens]
MIVVTAMRPKKALQSFDYKDLTKATVGDVIDRDTHEFLCDQRK